MSNKSILFITTQLPFPPKSGGTIKSWNYIQDLSKRYDVGLASLLKDDDQEHLGSLKDRLRFKHLITQKVEVNRNALSLIKSYLGYPCLNVFRNFNRDFMIEVEAIAQEYDAILIDHYEVFQYVPKSFQGKVIIHTHNAEFELWNRMASVSKNPLYKIILNLEANRVLNYERKIFSRSDLIYATPADIECFKSKGIDVDDFCITYHLGNDQLLKLTDISFQETEKAMIFMGTLSWEPNIDGMIWFIEKVFPMIHKKHSDIVLYILGKQTDDRLQNIASKYEGVKLCGFVEDIDNYLKRSRVFLAPLRFGSGMKVKVLEGMYRGIPIVTTEVGAEGLEIKSGEELMVAKDAESYAKMCLDLLENEQEWTKLRDNSRKKAAELYTWQPLFERMDEELKKVLK